MTDKLAGQIARVIGYVDRVCAEHLEGDDLEGTSVRGGEYDGGGCSVGVRLHPPLGDHAPPVAGAKAGEVPLGPWCGQIVADGRLVCQELVGHDGTYGVPAEVLIAARAGPVAIEAGHRIGAALFEFAAEDVALTHARQRTARRTVLGVTPPPDHGGHPRPTVPQAAGEGGKPPATIGALSADID